MIAAYSVNRQVVLSITGNAPNGFRLERCKLGDSAWLTFTGYGFTLLDEEKESENEILEDEDNGGENNGETETNGDGENEDKGDGSEDVGKTESEGSIEESDGNGTDEPSGENEDNASGDNGGDDVGNNRVEAYAIGNNFLDTYDLEDTLYIYRCIDFTFENPCDKDYEYSNNVRVSGDAQVGYTFGNYHPAPGTWGEVVTADDLRYTYLWGTDFKATNGQSFTDEQIEFYINASVADIARQLDITIVKQKIRSDAVERGLEKGKDYDVDEAVYDFKWERISRYGLIKTKQRPILKLHKLTLLSRLADVRDITKDVIVDKTKGLLKLLKRPIKPTQTSFGIQTAINQYGSETMGSHLFYRIDYDAGFETSDDVPTDLREIIAKHASVNLLNIIGDGLMSGFSSSSLSMDGLSESFSSTQSATSAYFGARIKEYKDDIEDYIKANRNKFGHIVIGCL